MDVLHVLRINPHAQRPVGNRDRSEKRDQRPRETMVGITDQRS